MINRRQLVATPFAAAAAAASWNTWSSTDDLAILSLTNLVIGFPAGGSTDTVARVLADKLRGIYAKTVVVENRPGAGGRIALEQVKRARPDGSSVLLAPSAILTLYPHIYRKLSYDPIADFVPVTSVCSFPMVLAVGAAVPTSVKTVAQYLDWVRQDSSRRSAIGNGAPGGPPEFAASLLSQASGLNMVMVSYKGGAPLIQDLLGGQLPAGVNVISEPLPFLQEGKLRALAVIGRQRSSYLPGVPTLAELGFADLIDDNWFGVYLPAKATADTVRRLSEAVRNSLQTAEVKDLFAKAGLEPVWRSPLEFAELTKGDLEKWRKVVQTTGYVPQQ